MARLKSSRVRTLINWFIVKMNRHFLPNNDKVELIPDFYFQIDPRLEELVWEYSNLSMSMIGEVRDGKGRHSDSYRTAQWRQQEIADLHGEALLKYLQPYAGLASSPTVSEWHRWQVANSLIPRRE